MAKKKSAKLPKKIVGVKIPKKLRKSSGKLIAAANTPAGRELIAAGLVAAGTALARAQKVRRGGDDPAQPEIDAAEKGAQVAGQIGAVMGAAANAALDRLFGGGPPEKSTGAAPAAGTRAH